MQNKNLQWFRSEKRALILAASIALIAAASLHSCVPAQRVETKQKTLESMASADELAEASKPPITMETLPNGLSLFALENHSAPIVTVMVAVKAGAYVEPPEWNGLMHFYEHMFFKGNKVIPDQTAFILKIQELGIVFNGTTSDESVRYYFTMPKDKLEEGLKFMYDAVTSPLFDEKELEKEKGAVMSEFDRNEAESAYWFNKLMDETVFYKYPERKHPLGKREIVKAATKETMKQIQSAYYVPNNAALFVAGDINAASAMDSAKKIFAGWEKGEDPSKKYPAPKHPKLEKISKVFLYRDDVKLAKVAVQWHGPSAIDDMADTYAADVVSNLLNMDSSGFRKRLVESGIAVEAYFGYYTQKNVGPIYLYAVCKPENVKKLLAAVDEELLLMGKDDYFSKEEIQRSIKSVIIRELYEREYTRSFTLSLGFYYCVSGIDYYLDYTKNIAKVTEKDVAAFMNKYVNKQPYVQGVLIKKDDAKAFLTGTEFYKEENGGAK